MSTSTGEPEAPPAINTSNIPAPKYDDLMVSPPPAYCPPEGMAGPPFSFMRTASFPLQYGAYDAYTSHQTSAAAPETLTPEAQALVDQYTVYFTELFQKWIDWAVLFWKYGVPLIKWSTLFFVRGMGGWREYWLVGGWFLFWVAPGLYLGIMGKQIQDIERFQGENEPWVRVVYNVFFWGAWLALVSAQWGSLLYITGFTGVWMWGLWGVWILIFGLKA